MQDVITNLKLADFCYPLKSSLMFYLQHIYFDIEKDMNEDFSMSVWSVIEIVIQDMTKFVEVMQRSKRSAGGGGAGPSRGAVAVTGAGDISGEMGESSGFGAD